MGRMKEYSLEIQERGYGEVPEKNVCQNCFSDEGLIELITNEGQKGKCSYCQSSSKTVLTLERVISHIMESLSLEWVDAADSGTPYETREGGYQGPVEDTYDLIREIEPVGCENEALFNDIINVIDINSWARPFSMPFEEGPIQEDWDVLVDSIKHRIRFLTFHESANTTIFKDNSWSYSDPRIAIAEISNTIERLNLVCRLPQETPIYRARFSEKDCDFNSASDMGTVPHKFAKQANRMSPIGIPMFYGALEPETAKSELDIDMRGVIHYGKFYPSRPLVLIDFTRKNSIPSIYSSNSYLRSDIRLMNGFIKDFSKPIKRDGSEHIEYIPTQVITEYLKLNYTYNLVKIDGILYNSTHNNKKACVLFVENEMCKNSSTDANDIPSNDSLILYLNEYRKEEI